MAGIYDVLLKSTLQTVVKKVESLNIEEEHIMPINIEDWNIDGQITLTNNRNDMTFCVRIDSPSWAAGKTHILTYTRTK